MQINTIAVIGGGTMGAGIAMVTAKAGLQTILIEKTQDLAEAAEENMTREMDAQIARWGMTESEKKLVLTNLTVGIDIQTVHDADLVITAVPDELALQKQLLSQTNALCKPETIFSSVTGVLSITELATALEHPEKMLGLHFLNPVFKTKLVEIVRGFRTSDDTYDTGKRFINSLGKKSIEVFESPGFVTTRVIVPLLNEAIYALLEGVASAEDIDMAMKLGYNMQMGPLELADRIGLDTLLNFMNHLFRETGELKFRPCPSLKQYVRAKQLGVKTGQGFFTYDAKTGKKLPSQFPG
ncbi:3-hydroxybutyryl-CoA dehydrogenase [candidate division KSB3 bacterium]|uniref:3-hydroxybutyryl-CoA dehydrogenase n=1 Tax=candidate division KSB3 bacterium TaxID=2044937 RepID=A0A9D5JU89_9BACT|nr:3-hydroxybutyryl-CoA dehydrogenase [candidate division KSB3 bacterium]MBD3324214.1 3-hydroxybutyryl-CoA dehydrogenase [candidate division KSB3 bacterium]